MTVGTSAAIALSRVVATLIATVAPLSQALASQGPGTAAGGASATTQLGMAILVYGLSAAILAIGLIGAVRQR